MNTFFILRELRKNQWKKKEELEEIQNKKLRHMIDYSYKYVRHYKNLFDSVDIKPKDIKTKEDLGKIPITTKEMIQKNFNDFIPTNIDINQCVVKKTSGSSGRQLSLLYNKKALEYSTALMLRPFLENGYKPTQIMAKYANPDSFPKNKPFIQKLGFFRDTYLSIFDDADKHINILEKINPQSLYGYASSLTLLANSIIAKEQNLFQPKTIFSSSELITKRQRNVIKTAFGLDVIDLYGSAEFYRMAWECNAHKGYHIDSDSLIMEFLKNNKPVLFGTEGNITVTGLYNFAMPLIRYEIGDIGIPLDEECPCGRKLPLMKMINGRIDDFLILPDGRKISPMSINMLDDVEEIESFKIIQKSKYKIVVQYVKSKKYNEETPTKLLNLIKRGLNEFELDILLEPVNKITCDKSGKIRTVISNVKN